MEKARVIHHRSLRAARLRRLGAVTLLLASLLCDAPALAQAESSRFGPFRHDRWMNYEGAPTAANAFAQTPDGWMWLAATEGLFRFDGLTFEQIGGPAGSAMEHASAWSLLVTKSGELWVGFGQGGGVAVYRNGRLEAVPMPQRATSIRSLAQTSDGTIWASADPGDSPRLRLFRWSGGRWDQQADAHLGLGPGMVWGLCPTGDGSLWVSLLDQPRLSLSRLERGGRRFEVSPYRDTQTYRCHVDAQGQLWFLNKPGVRLTNVVDGKERAPAFDLTALIKAPISRIGFDSAGGLWASTASAGLYHVPDAKGGARTAGAGPSHFTAADGLSSNVLWDVFVDREDNVWVGSELGVDRFRRASVRQQPSLPIAPGASWGLSRARDGVYVDTNYGIYRVAPGPLRRISNAEPGGQCPARGNGIWIIYPDDRIVHVDGGEKRSVPVPPNATLTSACAEDRLGRLWVGTFDGELRWHDDRGWHTPSHAVPKVYFWDLVPTPSGDIAYMTPAGVVQLIGSKAVITPLARWKPGTLSSISAGTRDLFVSGSDALLRIRDGKIARIDWHRFPWIAKLRGLVQTPRGETWLMTSQFISRVKTADLDRAFDDPRAPLERAFFDQRDGMGQAQHTTYRGPQVVAGDDGRIWQVNRYGVSFIDAPRLSPDLPPPPVVVRGLASAGKSYRDPASLVLPPGTQAFDIAYTALSYAYPERVRFRYRLDGVDADWVDAGSRRLASYTNLGAGRYRFHVIASENQVAWTNPGVTLDVEIKPTFVQSWPFKMLCAATALGLLWLAYSLRLRAVAHRIRTRMAERMAERERIARELHDTLLQSVQTLTLHFQVAVDDLPQGVPGRARLEHALDRADEAIAEGRDRVRDLRAQYDPTGIEKIIADIVERQGLDTAVSVRIETFGASRRLDPLALDEIVRIASEAIANVWRHARATGLTIEIRFSEPFTIRFVDDGTGIAPAILEAGGKSGHYGLQGMRERAKRLRGKLVVHSMSESGTELVIEIPGRVAYDRGGASRRSAWAQWVGRILRPKS